MGSDLRSAVAVLGLSVAFTACSAPPRPPDPLAPRAVAERGRWLVAGADGTALGRLVLLEIEDPAGPIRMYRAENLVGQWLGFLDGNLGVHQRVPFADREVFRGVYPMEQGLALLYEVEDRVALTPVDSTAAPAEAAVRFPPREDR